MERKGNKAFMVKDTKEARMAFIKTFQNLLRNKDDEHLKKYEAMWSELIADVGDFACKYYHNLTEDEFTDHIVICELARIDKTKK